MNVSLVVLGVLVGGSNCWCPWVGPSPRVRVLKVSYGSGPSALSSDADAGDHRGKKVLVPGKDNAVEVFLIASHHTTPAGSGAFEVIDDVIGGVLYQRFWLAGIVPRILPRVLVGVLA